MSDSARPHGRQPTRLPRPWDSPGKNTGVGCHFLLQCVKVKLLSHVRLLATPWTAAHQAPPSMGFSRQEHWSGEPLPSFMPNFVISYIGNLEHSGLLSYTDLPNTDTKSHLLVSPPTSSEKSSSIWKLSNPWWWIKFSKI